MGLSASNKEKQEAVVRVIKEAGRKWPSSIVARSEVPKFTGGSIKNRTMANKDSLGVGPKGAFKVGRNVVYPVDNFCDWLIQQIAV